MKLNNKGWGLRDMIIYTSVILLFFFLACYFIGIMYNDFDEDYYKNDNQQDVVEDVTEDEVVIDYSYYYDLEEDFENGFRQYLNDMSYDVTSDIYSIKLNKLVEEGYLNRVYDYVDNSVCDGYANAIGEGFDYKINTYLMCSNYTTEGYFGG